MFHHSPRIWPSVAVLTVLASFSARAYANSQITAGSAALCGIAFSAREISGTSFADGSSRVGIGVLTDTCGIALRGYKVVVEGAYGSAPAILEPRTLAGTVSSEVRVPARRLREILGGRVGGAPRSLKVRLMAP